MSDIPEDVKRNLANWKLKYHRLIVLDNKFDNQTYILRPPTVREYELLMECVGSDALAYIPPVIAANCILFPYTDVAELDQNTINHIVTNLQDKAGFPDDNFLEKLTIEERNSYDPRTVEGKLKNFRAMLAVQGGIPWSEVNDMNFDQMIKRIVAIEIAMKKSIIMLEGYDNRGRKVSDKKGSTGKWQDGVPKA